MARSIRDPQVITSFLAFGRASIACMEVSGLVMHGPKLTGEAADLFVELQVARARLRCLFARGRDEDVSLLAGDVLVLADRTAEAIERTRSRPGG